MDIKIHEIRAHDFYEFKVFDKLSYCFTKKFNFS